MGNDAEIKRGPTQIFKFALVFILLIVFGRASVSLYLSQWEKRRVKTQVEMKKEPSPTIIVHVAGAVKREGVYTLKAGARVKDAVAEAGGFADYAEKDELNLATPLKDGEKLVVPPERAKAHGKREPLPEGFAININTASELDFQVIPGIGPTISRRIVDLRETRGPFQTIEEIKLVQGIGDYRFEQIKKYLTIGGE